MEWSKIKNILIIALLLTNILLLFMIIFDGGKKNESEIPVPIDEAISILEKNGITVSCPTDFHEIMLSALTLTFDEDNGIEYYATDPKISLDLDKKTAKKTADSFIEKSEAYDSIKKDLFFVSANPFQHTDGEIYYTVSYGGFFQGYRLTDCYLICTVTPSGVSKIEKHWAKAEISSEKAYILPLSEGLLTYMTGYGKNQPVKNREITDISLVYSVESPMEDKVSTDTAFPSWKITSSDGKTGFVNAYSLNNGH